MLFGLSIHSVHARRPRCSFARLSGVDGLPTQKAKQIGQSVCRVGRQIAIYGASEGTKVLSEVLRSSSLGSCFMQKTNRRFEDSSKTQPTVARTSVLLSSSLLSAHVSPSSSDRNQFLYRGNGTWLALRGIGLRICDFSLLLSFFSVRLPGWTGMARAGSARK